MSLIANNIEHLGIFSLYTWNLLSMYLLGEVKSLFNLFFIFNWIACFQSFHFEEIFIYFICKSFTDTPYIYICSF